MERQHKAVRVNQKRNYQASPQIKKKPEGPSITQMRDSHLLDSVSCKIGNSACAAKHVSAIQRTGLLHPMNESQKIQSMLRLQRQYGNRFAQRVIAQNGIQAKLKIGQPGDIYEQEAEKVAEQVTRMPEPQISGDSSQEPVVTSQNQEGSKEKQRVQVKSLTDQITPIAQRQAAEEETPVQAKETEDSNPELTPSFEGGINSIKDGGQPLPKSARSFFEPRFGANFSDVRVHTNSTAAHLAGSVNAKAFTLGQALVFGPGQYSPDTSHGKLLLAHELTHVVQQGAIQTSVQRVWTPDTGWRYTPPATVTRSIVAIQGIVNTTPDGIYGPNTREAVKRYQEELRDNSLYTGDIDGKWGPLTEAAHLAFAVSSVSATAPRRGYNCAGFAFKTFTWHNLGPTRAFLSSMTRSSDCSDSCNPRDYKFWLWVVDISMTHPGGTTPTSPDFHIVGGQTDGRGEGPDQVMSKNGERPVEGPRAPVDWMPASGTAIDQDGIAIPDYTWNISVTADECYCSATLP